MFKATGYRQHAAECLRLAQNATPVRRAHLLRMAKVWLEVAEQTEHSAFCEMPDQVIHDERKLVRQP
jgi:hypothetical protein